MLATNASRSGAAVTPRMRAASAAVTSWEPLVSVMPPSREPRAPIVPSVSAQASRRVSTSPAAATKATR